MPNSDSTASTVTVNTRWREILPKKLCGIGSICGVRCNILTTTRSALPESHRPISSIRIAASAFSVLLTMSGSSELTSPIRFWAFSSSIALPPPLTTPLNAAWRRVHQQPEALFT